MSTAVLSSRSSSSSSSSSAATNVNKGNQTTTTTANPSTNAGTTSAFGGGKESILSTTTAMLNGRSHYLSEGEQQQQQSSKHHTNGASMPYYDNQEEDVLGMRKVASLEEDHRHGGGGVVGGFGGLRRRRSSLASSCSSFMLETEEDPLSPELRKVLQEVAQTGTSTLLPWCAPPSSSAQDHGAQSKSLGSSAAATATETGASSTVEGSGADDHGDLDGGQMMVRTSSSLLSNGAASNFRVVSAPRGHHIRTGSGGGVGAAKAGRPMGSFGASPPRNSQHENNKSSNNFNSDSSNSGKASPQQQFVHRRPMPVYPSTCESPQPQQSAVANAAGPMATTLGSQQQQPPPRKKHRNGRHVTTATRRRYKGDSNSSAGIASGGGRKRPLSIVRSNNGRGTRTTTATVFSSSSGRGTSTTGFSGTLGRTTSGSEPDDNASQYECDSEGTSATTGSELSFLRGITRRRGASAARKEGGHPMLAKEAPSEQQSIRPTVQYKCLRDAFYEALVAVLDFWYRNRGGYKLSPAERRRKATLQGQDGASGKGGHSSLGLANGSSSGPVAGQAITEEHIFRQRRERLLGSLKPQTTDDGPPFTIQRIAEVLLSPERYYTQTHKLCNCFEKLLLVRSSYRAFGGSTGGDTSQSRSEEMELAALADEKGRLQRSLHHRAALAVDEAMGSSAQASSTDSKGHTQTTKFKGTVADQKDPFEKFGENVQVAASGADGCDPGEQPNRTTSSSSEEMASRELLEAAARASLRTKFDHVGIDPHSPTAVNNRDSRSMAESRSLTGSPPPPMSGSASPTSPPGLTTLLRQHSPDFQDQHHHPTGTGVTRSHSPIMFASSSGGNSNTSSNNVEGSTGIGAPVHNTHADPNMQLLQIHHAAAMAGITPFELMSVNSSHAGSSAASSSSPSSSSAAVGVMTAAALAAAAAATTAAATRDVDQESRSSASSDVDSESDDVSFDDSESDRSDGSDSGHVVNHNHGSSNSISGSGSSGVATGSDGSSGIQNDPAARATALIRFQQQQQQRLQHLTASSQHLQQQIPSNSGLLEGGGNSSSNGNSATSNAGTTSLLSVAQTTINNHGQHAQTNRSRDSGR